MLRRRTILVTSVCLFGVPLLPIAVPANAASEKDKEKENRVSVTRILGRDMEKDVRKLRDRAVAGARKADTKDARAHYQLAAEELSQALNECVEDAKKVEHPRARKKLRNDDQLKDTVRELRRLLNEAEKRQDKGRDAEAAARYKMVGHLATGLREFSAARIAESLDAIEND